MTAQFGTLSADGDTNEHTVHGGDGAWGHYSGSFGGGTLTVYFKGLDQNWHAISGSDKTSADDFQIEVPHGTIIKGTLTGATSPTVYWQFHSVRV
jgi:hypothetical protein